MITNNIITQNKDNLEKLVFETGLKLLKQSQKEDFLFFGKNWWYKKILSWTLKNKQLKTNLFRFIDVLPSLQSQKQFLSHFDDYFKEQKTFVFLSALKYITPSLMVKAIKNQTSQVAKMFITGSDNKQVLQTLSKNWKNNFAFSMDILGEATLSEQEAQMYFQKYMDLMDDLLEAKKRWPEKKLLEHDLFGPVPALNLSVKASSVFSQINPMAWEYSKEQIKKRLRPILQKAAKSFIFINLDMETYHHKNLFLETFKELVMEPELKNYPHFGIVIQTYLTDSLHDIQNLAVLSKKRNTPITIRLVKGAYWDYEVLLAKQKNWPVPVYTEKTQTDANFERCMKWLFENPSNTKIAIASHNIRSVAYALVLHNQYPHVPLEFQVLYGMADAMAKSLQNQNHCVRLYCTMGELIPGMSYLVRRLLENSSNQSFILNSFIKKSSPEDLLLPPKANLKNDHTPTKNNATNNLQTKEGKAMTQITPNQKTNTRKPKSEDNKTLQNATQEDSKIYKKNHKKQIPDNPNKSSIKDPVQNFTNHPLMDFSLKENREQFKQALQFWKSKFPIEVSPYIQGKWTKSPFLFKRENPSKKDQIISKSFFADKNQAELATQNSHLFFDKWRLTDPKDRISFLKNLALLIKKKEFILSSLQVFEVGKTWNEAQADVAEAIDFCNYYALSYEKLIKKQKTAEVYGEENSFQFEAIGSVAVIAPWNFPFAILTGMTVAPLVCGNTVLIKPAEQSPVCAFEFTKLLLESGFPKESFCFLPGKGEEIGAYLVESPKVSVISFTGSLETGKQILKKASHVTSNQKDIKRCIVEMGGKNAIVIDSSADLDEAISGVLKSAFGFQGQKCSACSRVIILEDIYESFIARFLPSVASLVIGNPEDPKTTLGPLIDEESFNRVKNFIQQESSLKLFDGSLSQPYFLKKNKPEPLTQHTTQSLKKETAKQNTTENKHGWFIPPVVYLAKSGNTNLMQQELFAPVLAILKVKDLDTAIKQTNATCFGLTAAFYSRHNGHIEKFKQLAEVGNLYINRNCTGALVKRHPFGGRKMSGLGSKAGGPEYLKQFLHTKIVSENTIRRGFSPELL